MALLLAGAINEIFTRRNPVIPPRLFKVLICPTMLCCNDLLTFERQTRTTAILLISTWLHALAFFTSVFVSRHKTRYTKRSFSQRRFTFLSTIKSWVLPPPAQASGELCQFDCNHKTLIAFRMIPFSVVASITAAGGGAIISITGRYRPTMWASWAIGTVGYGVMTLLDSTSNT